MNFLVYHYPIASALGCRTKSKIWLSALLRHLQGHLGNTFVGIMVHTGGIPYPKQIASFPGQNPPFFKNCQVVLGGREILYPQPSRTGVSGFTFALGGLVATNFTQGVFQYITNHFRYLKWRYSPI